MREAEHNPETVCPAPRDSTVAAVEPAADAQGLPAIKTWNPGPRLLTVAALLAGIQIGVLWAATMGMPHDVSLPSRQLREIPNRLGPWNGADAEVDPRLAAADHAYDSLHRLYSNAAGERISLYAAVFTEVDVRIAPHSPEGCYAAAGYRIDNSRDTEVSSDGKRPFSARLLGLDLDGQISDMLFWYQVPGTTYVDCYGQRKVFYSYRGKKEKPAVVKIMLISSGPRSRQSAESLKDLAAHVHAWVKQSQEAQQRP